MSAEDDKKFPDKAPLGDYPFNSIHVWPDGRELHINYTPGNETTRYFTSIGAGFEIDKDGRMVQVANNRHDYTKGGSTAVTDKNHDHKVGGGSRTSVDTGSHTEVGGTTSHAVKGPQITASQGTHYHASTDSDGEATRKGDQVEKIEGSVHLAINGDYVNYIKGTRVIQVSGEDSEHIQSGNKTTEVSGNYKIICKDLTIICDNLNIQASQSITMNAGSTIDVTAQGKMTLKGSTIDLNPSS